MQPGDMRGLTIGKVAEVGSDEHSGMVKLRFPWLDPDYLSEWVSVAQNAAGPDRGTYFVPREDDEMIVGFLHGEFSRPVILGATWNPQALAPTLDPRQWIMRSPNGHAIRFIDPEPQGGDQGALVIEDAHQNRITMTATHIRIDSPGVLQLFGAQVVIGGPGWHRTVRPGFSEV